MSVKFTAWATPPLLMRICTSPHDFFIRSERLISATDIARPCEGLRTVAVHLFGRSVELLVIACGNDDTRSLRGERLGQRMPQPAARSGDENNFVRQIGHRKER